MYEVIEYFEDLQDERYKYHAGDIYPRAGLTVSEKRIGELESGKNRRRLKLIRKIEEPVEDEAPKKRGRKKNAD